MFQTITDLLSLETTRGCKATLSLNYYILSKMTPKVAKTLESVKKMTNPSPRRPITGGTNAGKRPARFVYWRVGYGDRSESLLEFWITRAGEYHSKPRYSYIPEPEEQESWTQLYYVVEGEAMFTYPDGEFPARPGDLVIIPARISFECSSQEGVKYHWLTLQGVWPAIFGNPPTLSRLSLGEDASLKDKFVDLREMLILQKPGYALRAEGAFYDLMARVEEISGWFSEVPNSSVSMYPDPVRNAIIYIEENFTAPFDATKMAGAAGVSKSHLRALFEKWLGESPKQFHTRCRIREAKHLLREQQLTVYEAALRVGFTDRSHFSRVFKQFTGVSPHEYGMTDYDKIK